MVKVEAKSKRSEKSPVQVSKSLRNCCLILQVCRILKLTYVNPEILYFHRKNVSFTTLFLSFVRGCKLLYIFFTLICRYKGTKGFEICLSIDDKMHCLEKQETNNFDARNLKEYFVKSIYSLFIHLSLAQLWKRTIKRDHDF